MSQTVTLELSDILVQSAQTVAAQTQRRVEDVLVEWLEHSVQDVPVDTLSDAQVLALSDLQMSETQQSDLRELLTKQREGTLTDSERVQLSALMDTYRRGMVRKAQALHVAIVRGLRPPLD